MNFLPGTGYRVEKTGAPVSAECAKKILIVDDEPAVRSLLERTLREAGFDHLVFCTNGHQVPLLAAREHPQLIVMDVMMPGGNGLRALRALKANPATLGIPVIVMSGYDMQVLGECASDFADRLLVKPFSPSEILGHVSQLLAA